MIKCFLIAVFLIGAIESFRYLTSFEQRNAVDMFYKSLACGVWITACLILVIQIAAK